jgi:hypothetical protein
MITGNFDSTCRLVGDCPLIEDCKGDEEADYSQCPMKFLSFDELLSEPASCSECDSLNEFEATIAKKLTSQDHKDLSLYWMEHLNSHLERFEQNNATRAESRQI